MTGVEIAVLIWSASVPTTLIVCGYQIHKKSKNDHKEYQHNFYHYIGNKHAELEEEERPLMLALPAPREEQPQRESLRQRFRAAWDLQKAGMEELKAREEYKKKLEEPPTPEPLPAKVPLSLAQMRNADDDETAMDYYDIVTDMFIGLIKHSQTLEQRYPEVKLIRDTSKSGYPGIVSTSVLTKAQWEHAMAKDGIFWEAMVLEVNERGNTILTIDHEYRLEQWLVKQGYEFEKEGESEEEE